MWPESRVNLGDVDRATCQGIALNYQGSNCLRPFLLLMASMMTLVSRRNVAISAGGYLFEALIIFTAQFADVFGRTLFQLGMILLIPCHERVEGLQLAQAPKLLFSSLGKKAAALPAADQAVNLLSNWSDRTTCVRRFRGIKSISRPSGLC